MDATQEQVAKQDAQDVLYEVKGAVAVISLNKPEVRNAQDADLLDHLDEAWTRAEEDDDVRVIIVRANGPHFSAGHDIGGKAMSSYDTSDPKRLATQRKYEVKRYIGYSRHWRDVAKPSIAAVQGACIAGGLLLAWPCDLIVASEDAFFSDPVIMMGAPGVEYHGHTWELGARRAKEFLFTGRRITALEAHEIGMVNRVVPREKLDESAMELAEEIAVHHPFALALTKRVVNQTLDIQGQYASLQSAFDMHWLGHSNALVESGYPILVTDPATMKKRMK